MHVIELARTVAVASLSTFCLGYNTGIVAGAQRGIHEDTVAIAPAVIPSAAHDPSVIPTLRRLLGQPSCAVGLAPYARISIILSRSLLRMPLYYRGMRSRLRLCRQLPPASLCGILRLCFEDTSFEHGGGLASGARRSEFLASASLLAGLVLKSGSVRESLPPDEGDKSIPTSCSYQLAAGLLTSDGILPSHLKVEVVKKRSI